nr:RNA-dependent RNA polymerase [Clover yellow mosaic virus]
MARVRASLSQFTDPSQKILIQSDQYENVKKTLGTYKLTNPYAHSESTADLLEDLGIATNPFAAEPHTHGAAKAIENDLYYIASTRMNKEEPITFMFMKRAKLQYFRRGPQQNDVFINQIVEPKDVARYDEDTLHSTIPTIDTKIVFIGDTLHFLPPSFLTKLFARNPKIQTVLATMVLPTEALYGLTSLYPNVYSLSYHKPSKFRRKALFSYAPGGHRGAEYVHELKQIDWLRFGHITDGRVHVTAQRLETKAANHLFIYKRGKYFTPEIRNFNTQTKYVTLPKIFLPAQFNHRVPIKKTLVMQLFLYVKTVSAAKERDIWAKIRQLIKTEDLQEYSPTEIVHLVNYFLFIAKTSAVTCFDSMLDGSIIKKIFGPVIAWFKRGYQKIFGLHEFNQLLEALTWEEIDLTLDVLPVRVHDWRRMGVADNNDPFNYPVEAEKTTPQWIKDFVSHFFGINKAAHEEEQPMDDQEQHYQHYLRLLEAQTLSADEEAALQVLNRVLENPTTQAEELESSEVQLSPPDPEPVQSKPTSASPPTPNPKNPLSISGLGCSFMNFGKLEAERKAWEAEEEKIKEANRPILAPTLELPSESKAKEIAAAYRRKAFTSPTMEDQDDQATSTPDIPELDLEEIEVLHNEPAETSTRPQEQGQTTEATLSPNCPTGTLQDPPHLETKLTDILKGRVAAFHSRGGEGYSYTGFHHKAQPWNESLNGMIKAANFQPEDFDHCLIQRYNRGYHLKPHADDEPCYPKNNPILTINLEGQAEFIISRGEVKTGYRLGPNSWILMPSGLQETHKHEVVALTGDRTSLTFRSTKPLLLPKPQGLEKEQVEQELPWKLWLGVLNSLNFKGTQRIMDGNNQLIFPIKDNKSLPKYEGKLPETQLLEQLKEASRFPCPYKIDSKQARAFASDVKNNRTGSLTTKQPDEWKEAFTRMAESQDQRVVALTVIHGAGGSGKSQLLQRYLMENPDCKINTILPTNELRNDWLTKLPKMPLTSIQTFERALISPQKPVVIFDDYSKMPAGYIDAFLALHKNVEWAILTGDPRQSTFHESNEQAMINHLTKSTEHFSQYSRYYINATHRNKQDLARFLGVYSEKTGLTSISMSSRPEPDWHLLVPSLIKKRSYTEMGYKTSTYAGCQGITADRVQVLLDTDTTLCSDQVLYTALSRAVHAVHFINTSATSSAFWDKLNSTPYLKTFLSTLREDRLREEGPKPEEPEEPKPATTHFPVENENLSLEDKVEELLEKHEREIYSTSHGHSNCVQTDDPVIQLFSHQQAKDQTLLWATIEARLKISNPKANLEEFRLKKNVGDVLWLNYKKAMKLPDKPIEFSQELWHACAEEVQKTYLSKPLNMIKNGENRQSPDYDKHTISLFLKSQWVKKLEKLGAPKIKPGQTIASFQQATVMLYGTMARYMRRIRQAFQPPNIQLNCERTPQQLTEFIKDQWTFDQAAYANDFTQFDQSQDGAMLQFEVLKAKHHNIPEAIIQGYIDIKTNAKVFTGVLAIMRLTGEGPTFDANTECNIAFNHTRFHISDDTAQLYAGDDTAFSKIPTEKASFQGIAKQLTLTSKPLFYKQRKGDWAEFCGYSITPLGLIKEPRKLQANLTLAIKQNKIKDTVNSYSQDVALAYQHKDALYEIFNESQMRDHQTTVRTLIKFGGNEILANY